MVGSKYFSGLWRSPDFLKLWVGETISLLGSQTTMLALPLVAALTLNASPIQMGWLGTLQYIPWLLIGLFAGAWADRLRRRPIMIVADLGRAVLLGFIPFAALGGFLRIEHLYVIGFLVGILNVFFEVAYAAFLPSLVSREQLVEGNSKLQTSASIAEIGGPGLAGWLIQVVSAPIAMIVDSLSFLVSAMFLSWIRTPEPNPGAFERRKPIFQEILDGLRIVLKHPILRAFALTSTFSNFFLDVHLALYILYVTRELGIEPVLLGAMYTIASVGGLIGSLLAERVVRWFGIGRVLIGLQILVGISALIIPLAGRQLFVAVPLIAFAQALWGMAAVIFVVNASSIRQAIVTKELQGRVMASMRFLTWGISPFGFLLGGTLGEHLGLQSTLIIAGLGMLSSFIWLFFSPLRSMREPPSTEAMLK
jgi:MFS family permease